MAEEQKGLKLKIDELNNELNKLKWEVNEYYSDYHKATDRYIEAEVVSDSLRSENDQLKNRIYDLEQVAIHCRKQLEDIQIHVSKFGNANTSQYQWHIKLKEMVSLDPYAYAARVKVKEFFRDDTKANTWWETSNPLLGDVSPKNMCEAGRSYKLMVFVNYMLSENQ